MFELILQLLLIAFILCAIYFIAVRAIMFLYGCSQEEAHQKIVSFFSDKPPYHITTDSWLINRIWMRIKGLIGDKRFSDLEQISMTAFLFHSGYMSGLPYIAFTVMYDNENEKIRIEKSVRAELEQCLKIHNFPDKVLTEWSENTLLQLPMLILRYAETESERKIIYAILHEERQKTLQRYHPIQDEEEEISE